MNGSRTSPAGIASTPVSTASRSIPSVKFWMNQLARTTVAGTPDANRMSSTASRARLATTREQHDVAHARVTGHLGEAGDGHVRSGCGDVGHVGRVEAIDAGEGLRPPLGLLPVERGSGAASQAAHGVAALLEEVGDTAAGLA